MSAGNLGGRIGWASASDFLGRRETFYIFTFGSVPLYFALPYIIRDVIATQSYTSLLGFMGSTVLALSMMGGTYALLPAYESELFGQKYVGANHGRMLLFSSAAALTGPVLLLKLKGLAETSAIQRMLSEVDPTAFLGTFGVGVEQAQSLIETKVLTIPKLLAIMPDGYVDPTPFLYDTTMQTMAGLMLVAGVSNVLITPVDPKHYEVVDALPDEPAAGGEDAKK
mmetsp:Transcript_15169/g.51411  ORF Transcript_15169/g.51411 Transcript_15169/m.51411 type:complete len:225 (+) Transcript_15169:1-675(+)